ncbi:hypothetical protein M6B38_192235 [Iris pallida]|uniref:Uncharacterized protein n=1 Tax=Iris pallida TaxID=29817 RepID=A0AAX6EF07_IRIPA|nr:hypothetical protein M6B38_192235 [Iris pallida]
MNETHLLGSARRLGMATAVEDSGGGHGVDPGVLVESRGSGSRCGSSNSRWRCSDLGGGKRQWRLRARWHLEATRDSSRNSTVVDAVLEEAHGARGTRRPRRLWRGSVS